MHAVTRADFLSAANKIPHYMNDQERWTRICLCLQKRSCFHHFSAEKRYTKILQQYPEIIQRFPHILSLHISALQGNA